MFKAVWVALVVFLSAVPSDAQSIWAGAFSKYMTQHGVIVYDKPVIQADVTWNLPHGAYFDLWADQSFDGKDNEVDYTLGWDTKYAGVSFAYFDLNPVGKSGDVFMTQASAGIPRVVGSHNLRFYGKVNRLAPKEGKSGTWFRIGMSDAWNLSARTTIGQSAWIMHDGGAFGGPRGYIARYEMSMSRKLRAYAIQPVLCASVPLNMRNRETQIVAGVKFLR